MHFTSGYGALWLAMFVLALATNSNIRTGEYGFYGFPVLALAYALLVTRVLRKQQDVRQTDSPEARLLEEIRQLRTELEAIKKEGFLKPDSRNDAPHNAE